MLTQFEGNEFVIDILTPGAAVNWRSYITSDNMYVDLRVKKEVKALLFMKEDLDKILLEYENEAKKINLY